MIRTNPLQFWKEKNKNAEGEYKKLCIKQIKLYTKQLNELLICPTCNFKIYEDELKMFKSCGQCGSKAIFIKLKGGLKK